MIDLPATQAVIPMSVSLHSARVEVVDRTGRALPQAFLHHLNMMDPRRRDLFLPTGLHVLAVSKETPALRVPRRLLGLPLERGQQLVITAMLTNPTQRAYPGVRARVVFEYTALGPIFPLFRAYPWVMDAMFPLGQRPGGSKAFDLPPGRTVRSWESSPAIPGYIVGLGGHVHDHAISLELTDVTIGQTLWRAAPVKDPLGRVVSMPIARFYSWRRLGLHIVPTHRYRITVTYENPTGRTLPNGGMGAVAGLFIPEGGAQWPLVDTTNVIYRQDLHDTLVPEGASRPMEHMHH
ncbi:MAG: hypothetical protein M3336_17555 [Chloroflexota bacterium]|nr:hypothetical protein [Chloroflexota bacterium]